MEFGFDLPVRGPMANPDDLSAIAQRGEALGFACVVVPDHIVIPNKIVSTYPYAADGVWLGASAGEALEQLTLLSYLVGVTHTLRILTSVMVVPHRNPVMTAKLLATADVLSGGRITVGCGVGWMQEEFEAVGAEPFEERGRVADEYLAVFRELWTSDKPSFDGAYAKFDNIAFLPKPVQTPHPPLWIGGESAPALRRAARAGDAWYPIGNNPKFPLDTWPRYEAAIERLHGFANAAGRDPKSIGLAYRVGWYDEPSPRQAHGGEADRLFTGDPQAIADDIARFRALGVRDLTVNLTGPDLAATLDRLQRFAEEIMPLAAST